MNSSVIDASEHASVSFDVPKLVVSPAYEQVSAEIERRIMTGQLRPSDVLPSESDLAERFGVNRATVREGIRRLESNGFVRRVSRKRLVISLPQHGELATRGSRALLLNQVTFNELWQVAMALEPLAAACAATLITDENVALLEANLEQTRKAIANGDSPIDLDVKFHALVADIARNKALLLAREPFALLLYPSFAEMRPHVPVADSRLVTAHAHIVEALKRRDGDEASAWMKRHIADFGRGWRLAGLDFAMPIASADREELDTSLDR
jgi:GntR family transcriptional regulator, transcriptional repressor for pyruvate dehydrogenase complex